jgi:hypothetical protein
MKTYTLLTTLALLLTGCGPKETAPEGGLGEGTEPVVEEPCVADDECSSGEICEAGECIEGDRDNDFETASEIRLNDPKAGVLNPDGDTDYYVYTSVGEEWIRVRTKNQDDLDEISPPSGTAADTFVQVLAANGALHASVDNFATGSLSYSDSYMHVYLPTAGEWYITVTDVAGLGGSDLTYELDLTEFTALTSEEDSLDAPSLAIEIDSASSIYFSGVNLEANGDSDFIEVSLPVNVTGQPLSVYGAGDISGSDADIQVNMYSLAGDLLMAKEGLTGTEDYANYYLAVDDTFVIEATDRSGNGSVDHWYPLYYRTYTEDYDVSYTLETEPNDSAGTASTSDAEVGEVSDYDPYLIFPVQGILATQDDEDWYEINVQTSSDLVSVRCFSDEFGSTADLMVGLFDGETELASNGDILDDYYYYLKDSDPQGSGTRQIRITSEDGVYGTASYYRCRILVAPFTWSS